MRLRAFDLGCVRSGRPVFAGVSFAVAPGDALLVLGRNGAGKSSLLRVVAGLVRLSAGRLAVEDGDPELSLPEQAHYLGHQDAAKPSLTVAENLGFWARHLGGAACGEGAGGEDACGEDAGIVSALAAVGLDRLADLPAALLSAGQRRRLSVARLIAVKRPLWLLDEPTSALDAASQSRLAGIMQAHRAAGGIILAAAHGPIGLDDAQELRLGQEAGS